MELEMFWDLIIIINLTEDENENNPDSPKQGYIDQLF